VRRHLKYALSLFKRNWTLDDYPVRVRFQEPELPSFAGSRLRPIPWVAQIEGWLLSGHGDSRGEALADLNRRFEEYRASHAELPRPGAQVPVAFADTGRVSRLQPLADEFLRRIFELDPADCLITDESSLWDFSFGHSLEPVFNRIRQEFGVDASEVEGANLAEILELIAGSRAA
jgi:hypothetical protein